MDDALGYAGKRVVVTGAASGMGEATATILVDLGAVVVGVDRVPVAAPVAEQVVLDLLDPDSIAAGAEAIAGPVDGIFNCAGLPGVAGTDFATMLVNFVGGRDLIERLAPRMPPGSGIVYVASAGGIGWQPNFDRYLPLFETEGYAAAKAWLEEHPDVWEWSGYAASKQAINAWVSWAATDYMRDHGVRLNCLNPGPTDTAMMPSFHALAGKDLVDASIGPIGRYSTASEQGWAMVLLNSPRATYVTGEAFFADGGFFGALQTGRLDMSALMPSGEA